MPADLTELITWRDAAACRDMTEVDFFPSPEDAVGISKARDVCSTCPVADQCLEYALETRQTDGIWGGHTTKERSKLRRLWLEEIRRAS
ncbi:MAG TPA: WhiB family transcriptional regulator [Acidimicrobiia bacterium]|nr:WhiB family transcriptional regulator [Acidimicrobiia bacterium]